MTLQQTVVERRVPEYMLRARQQYPRAYEPWSEEEDRRLCDLVAAGTTPDEMSQQLGRGPGGVTSRLHSLGLSA